MEQDIPAEAGFEHDLMKECRSFQMILLAF
jgi:hypothetical protein